MIGTILKSELRNMRRDRLYIFFAFYPVMLGFAGYYLIDYINDTAPGSPWANILSMFFIIMTGFVFGALTAFTLLDDKDDNVLMSLKITPISVMVYLSPARPMYVHMHYICP